MKRISFFSIIALALLITLGTSCKKDSMPDDVCSVFSEIPNATVFEGDTDYEWLSIPVDGIPTKLRVISFDGTTLVLESLYEVILDIIVETNTIIFSDCGKGQGTWNGKASVFTITREDDGVILLEVERGKTFISLRAKT